MKHPMYVRTAAGAFGLILSAGVLVAPAAAQLRTTPGGQAAGNTQRFGVAQRGGGSHRPGRPPGPGYPRPFPRGPYVIETPPPLLGPLSLGLIEQDFQMMRSTVKRPNEFLYGRWNPGYQVITPGPNYIPSYGGYYPGGYGYGYGGIGLGYGYGYGNGYGYDYPVQTPVIQQQFYYAPSGGGVGGGNGYAQGNGHRENVEPRREKAVPARETTPGESSGEGRDFYLRGNSAPGQGERLTDALDDIRKAWLNGDYERLKARIPTDGKVKVFPGGKYRYAQRGSEFSSMLHDAMARIDTLSFEFEKPKAEATGRAFVTGKHTFADASGNRQETYVSYRLERSGGRWLIVEAGSSEAPITRHEEAAGTQEK